MAEKGIGRSSKPKKVVERNIRLLEYLMRYLVAKPQTLESLPDNFELVILPDDDPELRLYNLALLDRFGSAGKPVVFVRLESTRQVSWERLRPSLYVPLAA